MFGLSTWLKLFNTTYTLCWYRRLDILWFVRFLFDLLYIKAIWHLLQWVGSFNINIRFVEIIIYGCNHIFWYPSYKWTVIQTLVTRNPDGLNRVKIGFSNWAIFRHFPSITLKNWMALEERFIDICFSLSLSRTQSSLDSVIWQFPRFLTIQQYYSKSRVLFGKYVWIWSEWWKRILFINQ